MNAAFVARMEDVLAVYERPDDPRFRGSSCKRTDLHGKPRYQKGQLKNRLEKGDSKQSGGYARFIKKDFLFDKPRICYWQ